MGRDAFSGAEQFQSTLPQGERHPSIFSLLGVVEISIHAPARGATGINCKNGFASFYFNPRSRKGSDKQIEDSRIATINISIHAPARGATKTMQKCSLSVWNFNPRSRKGSDGITMGGAWKFFRFQSTLPQGERHVYWISNNDDCKFQSTLPQGERRNFIQTIVPSFDFNPRSRKGSDQEYNDLRGKYEISIHAPARGATLPGCSSEWGSDISIHAPARGATKKVSENYVTKAISIHAPARGATKDFDELSEFFFISIHAPARGATISSYHSLAFIEFQSTLPQGERRWAVDKVCGNHIDFNPRSRKGSDFSLSVYKDQGCKFQSTLPQGERQVSKMHMDDHYKISIHAPARGATNHGAVFCACFRNFNPRGWNLWHWHEWRATRGYGDDLVIKQDFNPRSRKGSDHFPAISCRIQRYFNPRSRKGSDRRED